MSTNDGSVALWQILNQSGTGTTTTTTGYLRNGGYAISPMDDEWKPSSAREKLEVLRKEHELLQLRHAALLAIMQGYAERNNDSLRHAGFETLEMPDEEEE